ncbi:MAG: HigA family addiction module antitoxin [Acidobacteria bacterium]|jgi:addiction module HigA family antidote|nr:HigA family addiction module antitoxin [Acidobacteriota bacterium]
MPMYNPPHPGEVIRTEIIEANGLTVTAAAKALGVSRQSLSGLLNSKVDLSGDMAVRIEKAFGPKMETLMGMQSAYDIFQTRQRAGSIKVGRFRLQHSPTPAV